MFAASPLPVDGADSWGEICLQLDDKALCETLDIGLVCCLLDKQTQAGRSADTFIEAQQTISVYVRVNVCKLHKVSRFYSWSTDTRIKKNTKQLKLFFHMCTKFMQQTRKPQTVSLVDLTWVSRLGVNTEGTLNRWL